MSDYILSCCSTADYPRSFFETRHINVLSFHYEMDGTAHDDDLYTTTTPHEFFTKLKAGSQAKTSQVSAGEYEESWEPFLRAGKDICHISLSSGISGTYGSACVARDALRARYPERNIVVIDSLAASSGYGLLVEYMADMRAHGATLDELVAWTQDNKLKLNHWFFVSDLDCLMRGGRVSKTSAMLATALKICPVMDVDYKGRLIPREKNRTKKKAIDALLRMCTERIDNGASYAGKCCITHSDCMEDARILRARIEEHLPSLAGKIPIYDIGTVIGAHCGPGTVAVFFMGRQRVE